MDRWSWYGACGGRIGGFVDPQSMVRVGIRGLKTEDPAHINVEIWDVYKECWDGWNIIVSEALTEYEAHCIVPGGGYTQVARWLEAIILSEGTLGSEQVEQIKNMSAEDLKKSWLAISRDPWTVQVRDLYIEMLEKS